MVDVEAGPFVATNQQVNAAVASNGRGRGRGGGFRGGRGMSRGRGRGRGGFTADGVNLGPSQNGHAIFDSMQANAPPEVSSTQVAGSAFRGGGRGGPRRGGRGGRGGGTSANGHAEEIDGGQSSTNQPVQSNDRRRKFASKLTEAMNGIDSATKKEVTTKPARLAEEYTDLRSRLIAELSSGAYDCAVCYSCVSTKNSIWSCSQCYSVLHLSCIQKWADSSVAKIEEQNARLEDPAIRNRKGTWRCPGCQFAREEVPRQYRCWDGQVVDPIGGKGSPPHSCGKPCSKGKCMHGCAAGPCHPGPCPPCPISITRGCFCGTQQITLRCSQLRQTANQIPTGLSCGTTCGKKLGCKMHQCSKVCHEGSCGDCEEVIDYQCYCGKHTKSMKCGQGVPRESHSIKGDVQWEGRWRCDSVCSRPFSCHKHECQRQCHSLEDTEVICPFSPGLLLSCPCGAETVNNERTSCTDEIKTCKRICSKMLSCGHECKSMCHLGNCPPCQVSVSTPCRCGESKKQLTCHERQKEEQEGGQEVLCTTVCRSLRLCGRHECRRLCCPLYFQAKSKSKRKPTYEELLEQDPAGLHTCDVICGKLLRCGTHHCEMNCHRGQCPPCLQASFDEFSCHCGRTVMDPPIPCGTTIQCHFPCTRLPPPCGHPKQQHDCHETEGCPPCIYLVEKTCICGKNSIANVPCHRSRVTCGQTCDAVLNCGFHRCQKSCHDQNGCDPCHQTCTKPRKCGHPCPEPCHAPVACPETSACQAWVTLLCACGHQQQQVRCGHSIHSPQTNHRTLKCNDSCLVAQRNVKLAEALGMQPSDLRSQATEYSPSILTFYGQNRCFAEEVEETLVDFIKSNKHAIIFGPPTPSQRVFIHELVGVFGLQSEDVDEEPKRSIAIKRGMHAKIAIPSLRDAYIQYSQNQSRLRFGQLKREDHTTSSSPQSSVNVNMNALLLKGMFGLDESSLTSTMRKIVNGAPIQLKWQNEEDVVVIISNSTTLKLRGWSQEVRSYGHINGGYSRLAKEVIVCYCNEVGKVIQYDTSSINGQMTTSMSRGGSNAGTPRTTGAWAAVAAGTSSTSSVPPSRSSAWGMPSTSSNTSSTMRATAPAFTLSPSTHTARSNRSSPHLASVAVPDEWDS